MPQVMQTTKKSMVLTSDQAETFVSRRIHLIGIGGSGMRALAGVLLRYGATVSGSDLTGGQTLEHLVGQGAAISAGQREQNLPEKCDLVVYSAAIDERNPELAAARKRGIEVIKYSQMLGRLMERSVGLAIAGTHGKSTTSAMVAYALSAEGLDPSFIVGATVEQLGGPSGAGRGRHFVAEACEFDRSFLNLHPKIAAILNIEEDHLDCYQDLDAIIEAFGAFSTRVQPDGVLVVNGEDRNVAQAVRGAGCEVETFGLAAGCLWRAENLRADRGCYSLDVMRNDKPFCSMKLSLPGLHNVYNALAAGAMLHHAGLSDGAIAARLGAFLGTRRRMTLKGIIAGITVLDDYAHHPTEIQVTLKAIREHYQPGRLFVVFQPHQHSRTRFLLKDFARSFAAADSVLVPDIYFVRDSQRERDYISSQDLVAQIRLNGGSAQYLRTFDEIAGELHRQIKAGDLVVTMGAGNVYEVSDEIIQWLGRNT